MSSRSIRFTPTTNSAITHSVENPRSPQIIVRQTLISRAPAPRGKIAAAITLFLMLAASEAYWKDWGGLRHQLPAIPSKVFNDAEVWRLFTALFIHSDTGHLFANFLGMGILSYLLFGYFGWLIYPVMTLFLGALVNALSLLTYPPETRLLGASGVVYLMAGFWLAVYVGIDRRFSLGNRLLRAVGFTLAMLFPSTIEPEVSYRTHLIGFLIGVPFGTCYFFARRKHWRAFERVEVEQEELEEN